MYTVGKSQFSIQTITQAVNNYNRILCNLLTNETIEVKYLISLGLQFHKVLPLYFIDFWPIELQINPQANCL